MLALLQLVALGLPALLHRATPVAHADDGPPSSGASVGLLASGEAVLGEALTEHFRASSSVGAEAFARLPVYRNVEAKVALGYRRLGGTLSDEWLWYAPVDLTVGATLPAGKLTLVADVGPSLVVWGATPATTPGVGSSGGNWGIVGEVGGRYPTSLVRPPLYDPDPTLTGVDLVVDLGFRWSDVHDDATCASPPCGFDFSALRVGAGLAARF